MHAILMEMASRQRANIRAQMVSALRARHFDQYAKLEKKHSKLAEQINALAAKVPTPVPLKRKRKSKVA